MSLHEIVKQQEEKETRYIFIFRKMYIDHIHKNDRDWVHTAKPSKVTISFLTPNHSRYFGNSKLVECTYNEIQNPVIKANRVIHLEGVIMLDADLLIIQGKNFYRLDQAGGYLYLKTSGRCMQHITAFKNITGLDNTEFYSSIKISGLKTPITIKKHL
jgi:hypothetical protein